MNTLTQSLPIIVAPSSHLETWHLELRTYLSHPKRKLAPRSQRLAFQHIHVFSKWYEAQFNQAFDPRLITNYDFIRYRDISLNKEKASAATWNNRLWAFTHLCTWLGDPSLLEGIEQKAQVRGSTKHRSLTDDEYHRLMHLIEGRTRKDFNDLKNRPVTWEEYINAVRDWASVILMLHGLRVDECASVCIEDLKLKERIATVIVRDGKGSKERTVTLHSFGLKAIASWLDVRPDSTTQASPKSTLLDLGEVGEARRGSLFGVSVRTLQRNVSALGTQIGVPDLTPHWLRYTFAKRLERNNVPLETIRELLGHDSIETTKRYLRSSLEELHSAVEGVM